MPRVPVHSVDDPLWPAGRFSRPLQARYSKVLNMHGEIAHSPALLSAYAAFNRALADGGSLDGRTREAIALAVGAANSGDYCQSAHTLGGNAAGLSVERDQRHADPDRAARHLEGAAVFGPGSCSCSSGCSMSFTPSPTCTWAECWRGLAWLAASFAVVVAVKGWLKTRLPEPAGLGHELAKQALLWVGLVLLVYGFVVLFDGRVRTVHYGGYFNAAWWRS